MKIRFDKEALIAAVTPAMSAVSDKNTIAAIEGILFRTDGAESCELSSYDLEKGFRTTVYCQVGRQGSFIINAAKLFRIIRMMPESTILIEVDEEKNMAKITSGKSEFCLPALPGSDFPNLPELSGEKGFSLPQKVLRKTILQIQHAIGIGEQRPVLSGAYFRISGSSLKVVACDGNRLAYRERQCSITTKGIDGTQISFIVPGKTLNELLKMIGDNDETVTLEFGRKHVIFFFGKQIFFSRLIDGEYIDYERVIPKNNTIRAEVDREELVECLERASLVTDDKSMGQVRSYVKCSFVGESLQVSSASSASSVYDETAIVKDGADIVIGFNCRYLLDALRAIDDERILLTLSTPLMSMTLEQLPGADVPDDAPEGEDPGKYLYMVCPVKMKE